MKDNAKPPVHDAMRIKEASKITKELAQKYFLKETKIYKRDQVFLSDQYLSLFQLLDEIPHRELLDKLDPF